MKPKIAFFDMDHTLIDNDCDVSWKQFLVDHEYADVSEMDLVDKYFEEYQQGCLDIEEFARFQLAQYKGKTPEEMKPLLQQHFQEKVKDRIYPEAKATVEEYKNSGVITAVLTATNGTIASPLVKYLEIDEIMATRLAMSDGHYTGDIEPPYCMLEGKIYYALQVCDKYGFSLDDAIYYGDSTSDIPMLEKVAFPVTVNPAPALEAMAMEKGWSVKRWRLE